MFRGGYHLCCIHLAAGGHLANRFPLGLRIDRVAGHAQQPGDDLLGLVVATPSTSSRAGRSVWRPKSIASADDLRHGFQRERVGVAGGGGRASGDHPRRGRLAAGRRRGRNGDLDDPRFGQQGVLQALGRRGPSR